MPYRIEVRDAQDSVFDRLVDLGALDAERSHDGSLAAVMPDSVSAEELVGALSLEDVRILPAIGRDADSVWILRPRPIQIGRLRIVPDGGEPVPGALRLVDAAAFGTGLHATTALCLEALDDIVHNAPPEAVLDLGTGSGVLALAALMMGVRRALGVDIDEASLRVAATNARINYLEGRLDLALGGPETVTGTWPLVLANVLAAPLIEMAPTLVRRVGHYGRLVLSGIPSSVEHEVERAYRNLGMRRVHHASRSGWTALVLQATW